MMKLSEAMRLGAMLHPQVFNHALLMIADRGICGTCALGAAFVAMSADPAERFSTFGTFYADRFEAEMKTMFPFLRHETQCPGCGMQSLAVFSIIYWHLGSESDACEQWTRERIADWIATVETQELEAHHETECLSSSARTL